MSADELSDLEITFYLQDARSYCGNDILFWALGGGYTTDVSKAEVFTEMAAKAQHRMRSSDLPWPKEYIDRHTRPAVDMQYVKYSDAIGEVARMELARRGGK